MTVPDDHTFVRFGSMQQAYEELQKIVTELDTVTDDLYADIKKELGASWEGDAEQFFTAKKNEWNVLEQEMGRQLYEAAGSVDTAKVNYMEAEKRNISIWMD
ncbi:WXG100 family type VII secretion target [Nonomuraea endophytica]|uniref:WXG100 family type VII secretion target n=1 Tax=Nonomuraea endophytica TaxID=714136 RepID=UPI0037C77E05